ncbi:MAG: VWA domain-containing protein [Bacteroidales bacterium]|nr:VWA domain-containing protein [Bacteroidales bacterium]
MRTPLLFLFVIAFTSISNCYSQNISDQVHYVLLIDKSKSMIGEGDGMGNNIWPDVLASAEEFIEDLPETGLVTVYTFAGDVSEGTKFNLDDLPSKDEIIRFLNEISIDGNNTAVYSAMSKVFTELVLPTKKEPVLIYIFTDGHDNRSVMNFDDILAYYQANRTDYVYSYYIKLRGNLGEELKGKIDNANGISAVEINEVDTETLFPVTITPKFKKLTYNLALKTTQSQLFNIQGGEIGRNFTFDAELTDVEPVIGNLALSKNKNYTFSQENQECEFEIKSYGDLKTERDKIYSAKIKLSNPSDGVHKLAFSPDEFEVEFSNSNPPKVIITNPWKRK